MDTVDDVGKDKVTKSRSPKVFLTPQGDTGPTTDQKLLLDPSDLVRV